MALSKDERYAALLDGRCTEEERRQLMAELAAGGEDLEIFADVAAILDEMEEEDRAAGKIPLRSSIPGPERTVTPPRRPPRTLVRATAVGGFLLAAGIAGLIILPRMLRPASGPAAIVAQLTDPDAPLPTQLALSPEPQRGGESTMTDPERVRLGVWLVELEVAAGTDKERARLAAQEIAKLLRRTDDPGGLAGEYRTMGTGGRIPDKLDPELARRAESISGGVKATRFGEWLMGAWIAADRKERSFFQTDDSQAWLEARGLPESLKPLVGAQLGRARTEVTKSTPDWAAVTASLTSMFRSVEG